jgi:MFS family permease
MINRNAIASLIISRFIYAANFFSVASVYPQIALDLKEGISGLGLITSYFYIGIGAFQVLAGIIAAKVGPKKIAVFGTLVYSVAALLSGLVADLYQLVILRFFVGLGMAFVFAPGVSLVAKYFRRGSEGFGIGLFNAAFGLGGAAGLYWSILGELIGWRNSLIVGGFLGLLMVFLLLFTIPKDVMHVEFRVTTSDLQKLFLDKWLLLLSVVLLGMGIGTGLVGSFIVFYLVAKIGADIATAGFIGSLTLLLGLITSPLAGRIYDGVKDVRELLFVATTILSIGVAVAAIDTVLGATLSAVIVGLASGAGFTVLFSAVREASKSKEYETLAVSWVNSLSFGGFWAPLLFSFLVTNFGYRIGWFAGAVITFVWIIPILFVKSREKMN